VTENNQLIARLPGDAPPPPPLIPPPPPQPPIDELDPFPDNDGNDYIPGPQPLDPTPTPQARFISAAFVSGLEALNQGGDLAIMRGLAQATRVSSEEGLGTFAFAAGGQSGYNSGSAVSSDINSLNLMSGVAYGRNFSGAPVEDVTLAAFIEYGQGSYDIDSSLKKLSGKGGGGDLRYLGGGYMARLAFAASEHGHFYGEHSFRAGVLENEYKNSYMRDALGRKAAYDSAARYYSFHFGGGYSYNIAENTPLELYAKYFYTRLAGDSVRLTTEDPVKFDPISSSRLRFGSRLSHNGATLSPYLGAAFEREFNGHARARSYNVEFDAPSLAGNTGVGELGFTLRPAPESRLALDFGLQGYLGKRRGWGGSLLVNWEF
jgi:hypothetical protein